MKKIFFYKDNIFNTDLLVCVGVSKKRILNYVKKKCNNESYKCAKENIDFIIEAINGYGGSLITLGFKEEKFYILTFKDWFNDWEHLEILVHEINNYKQNQFKDRKIKNKEVEFESYYLESTFRQF